ncbi:hypothetical protein GCM10025872_02050 [Barrientosiimonas endolithica]|uniref:Metallo-beta-lactamase domain-containing protein n=1 Tax=Barrientosiimonas endolithica TaxID=1535208 RepID=A0ABN6YH08_9MICO|nr:hypothetical protein GCM10025872_02050 [Barrientosiimonas endolithica]
MTLDGTNTWVLGDARSDEVVVVDPGPLDEAHLQAVLDHAAGLGARVALTLLTHHHADHTEAAQRWAAITGAPVRGAGRGEPLRDGEQLEVGECASPCSPPRATPATRCRSTCPTTTCC